MGGLPEYDSVVVLARSLIGVLFIVAGATKLAQGRRRFASVIRAYRIVPNEWAPRIAIALPLLEIAVGAGFALRVAPRLAGSVIAGLLTAFAFGVAVNLLRGRRTIDCGCFGSRTRRGISWVIVVRNVFLIAAVVAAAWGPGVTGEPSRVFPSLLIACGVIGIYAACRSVATLLRIDLPGDERLRGPPRDPLVLVAHPSARDVPPR